MRINFDWILGQCLARESFSKDKMGFETRKCDVVKDGNREIFFKNVEKK